jgi:hypothetical protein
MAKGSRANEPGEVLVQGAKPVWDRTKRLINSYLDELIERSSSPDRQVRQITRAEIARLNELEVQARGSLKLFEKELAEVELKMIGVSKREAIARERGDAGGAAAAANSLITLSKHRDLLKQQISEAGASAERARSLREDRRRLGEELATDTHLTTMRETIAGIQTPFDRNDPSATIDEMRERLHRPGVPTVDPRLIEAEREFEAERARKATEEILSRYKQDLSSSDLTAAGEAPLRSAATTESEETKPVDTETDQEQLDQRKSLGRTDGPIRPID